MFHAACFSKLSFLHVLWTQSPILGVRLLEGSFSFLAPYLPGYFSLYLVFSPSLTAIHTPFEFSFRI